MSEEVAVAAASVPSTASPKKAKKTPAVKKPVAKPTHPPTAEMVNAAIAALKEKKGSSLQAIKKYIAATYKLDVDKQSTFIKKYLKSSVEKKTIVQTKGTGASGRFKLGAKVEGEKKMVKKPAPKKATAEKKVVAKKPTAAKKPAAKKSATDKKSVTAKKPAAKSKVVKAAAKPKSPSKVKKTGKSPAAKPKAPKPKKAVAPKAKPAKK